jgi:enoyl-[acyl-carrier protein] reductase I
MVHTIAFAPKEDLQGGLLNCSAEGCARAMDISCRSFVRMAKLAAPLMTEGGSMFAMSYCGANRALANYNVMGPVKAALETACRYLAYELGSQGIWVHAIFPGPPA